MDKTVDLSEEVLKEFLESLSETGSGDKEMQEMVESNTVTIMQGYIDYAQTTIAERALVDGRDGLKSVQRRILYAMLELSKKNKGFMKCLDIIGKSSLYHPHGGDAIYQALVNLTDAKGGMNIPLIEGYGAFGSAVSNEGAAAYRYTEAKLHKECEDYFDEMNGIKMIPNFNATLEEPTLLPVKYPALLCNPSSGIAVGFSSNIPSFNFNDVLDLTCEYIEKGKCTTVIMPDFPTKGYYIRNDAELMKLMTKGKASLKLRGKVEVQDKSINIVEFPYGKTIQCILREIKTHNIQGIKNASDYQDHSADVLGVECTAKNRVQQVLMDLYRDTSLQSPFSAELTTVIDGAPVLMGVWDYVKVWVEWRREVLKKQYEYELKAYKAGVREPIAFMEILRDTNVRDKVVDLAVHTGSEEAVKYILEHCDNTKVDYELAKWAVRRGLNNFRNGDKYKKQYDDAMRTIKDLEDKLADIDKEILRQLKDLKARKGHLHPRQTEVTDVDYTFEKVEKEVLVDDSSCAFYIHDGFINKLRAPANTVPRGYQIMGKANDVLWGFDNYGHIFRIYAEHLPYDSVSGVGVYIPKYAGIKEQDARVIYVGTLDGKVKTIMYADGNIAQVDTAEWIDNVKQVKYLQNGISTTGTDTIGWVVDMPEEGTLVGINSRGQVAIKRLKDIVYKSRTARTRVFRMQDAELTSIAVLSDAELFDTMPRFFEYEAPVMRNITDASDFKVENMVHFIPRFL